MADENERAVKSLGPLAFSFLGGGLLVVPPWSREPIEDSTRTACRNLPRCGACCSTALCCIHT